MSHFVETDFSDVAGRLQELQDEARVLVEAQVREWIFSLRSASALALNVAQGGELFPVGIREVAIRAAAALAKQADTVQTLLERK